MNIQTIAEHSVDLDSLPKRAKVLDLGCLGFAFTYQMIALGHSVYAVDIQKLKEQSYHQVAITDYIGNADVYPSSDQQAARINRKQGQDSFSVRAMTLDHFSKGVGVGFWDLIKMDIEGSEKEVIFSLDRAPARQISIEFHLHTGVYEETDVQDMVNKLYSLGYDTVKHDKHKAHGCGMNYWDSLFILK